MQVETNEKFNKVFKVGILGVLVLFLIVISSVSYYLFFNLRPNDTISVTGTYIGEAGNQVATLTLNFKSKKPNKEDAENEVNTKTKRAMDLLNLLAIDSSNLKTTYFNSSREQIYIYDNNTSGTYKEGDWITNQTIEVTLRNGQNELISKIIADLSPVEIEISGPVFSLEENFDDSEIYNLALENAIRNAEKMAATANRRLGKVTSISENYSYENSPEPILYSGSAMSKEGDAATPNIPAGKSKISRSVYVTFELK